MTPLQTTTTFTASDHYGQTRQPIIDALSNIAKLTTNEESETAAKEMASYLIYASGGSFTSLLLDLKKNTPSRAFAYLIEALGFVPLGDAKNGLCELLQTLTGDSSIHIKEAAENACDMITFDEDPPHKSARVMITFDAWGNAVYGEAPHLSK